MGYKQNPYLIQDFNLNWKYDYFCLACKYKYPTAVAMIIEQCLVLSYTAPNQRLHFINIKIYNRYNIST